MGLSDSIIRQALSDNSGDQLVMQEIRKQQKILSEKEDFITNPGKLDKLAGEITRNFSPAVTIPKNVNKFSSVAEGYDSVIPENHPFSGMGAEVKNRLSQALQSPEYEGVPLSQIVQGVTNSFLLEPDAETGRTRLEKAYKYKREADAELKLGLNPFEEDKSVRELPGYAEWLKNVQEAEDEDLASESYFASLGDLAEASAWGAAGGAALGAIGLGVGAAPGAAAGAIASPLIEFFAHPIRRAAKNTEWYRSKVSSDSTFEKIKTIAFDIGTDIGVGIAGGGAGGKLVRTGLRKAIASGSLSEDLAGKFFKSGSALDAIAAGKAAKTAKLDAKRVEDFLGSIPRAEMYDSAIDVVAGKKAYEEGLGLFAEQAEGIRTQRKTFVESLQKLSGKMTQAVEADVEKTDKTVKQLFGTLTDDGAKKALETGVASGNLNGAITKVAAEEQVVKDVIKNEATDYVALLTGKEQAGKKIHATDKARATLQSAGYNVDEISSLDRRKLLRLANTEQTKSKPAPAVVDNILKEESTIPAALTPEAQGIQVTAKEAVEAADVEVEKLISEAESSGYLEAMMESGKIKANEIIEPALQHEGPVTSANAIDVGGAIAERSIPQEALIEDFIYENLEKKFFKKYGEEFTYWTYPEGMTSFKANPEVQKTIQKEYEFLQKKYGYDLTAMVPSKKKAVLKFGEKEGHSNVEFEDTVKSIRSLFDSEKILDPKIGLSIVGALTIPLYEFLSPKEAEASTMSNIGKRIPKVIVGLAKKSAAHTEEAKIAFLEGMRDAKYVPGELKEGTKKVGMEYFGRQMHLAEMAKEAGLSSKDIITRKKPLPFGIHNLMSPTAISNLSYKTGFSVAVQRAHLQTLWAVHTRDISRTVDTILKDVPGFSPSAKEIAKITEPFVERYGVVEAARAMEHRFESMESSIDRLYKKSLKKGLSKTELDDIDRSLNKAELGRDLLKKELDRLTPQVEAFNSEFAEVEKKIAQQFPSARVFYASEDTADFTLRPWLRGMVSYDEQVAAGHIKDLMETYALRMLEGHHKVITDSPYMHHAFHPKYSTQKAKEILDTVGINSDTHAAYLRFYKRGKYSKAFMPDAHYALNKYIPDAEKRILVSDFWRRSGPKAYQQSGWHSHMRSPAVQYNKMLSGFWNRMWTADEPELRTVGNKLANWYTAFETAALIGFSPATAFKHIFKNEGTWAQLGLKESLSHIPDAIGTASRNWVTSGSVQDGIVMTTLRKLGIDTMKNRKVVDKFADAVTYQNKLIHHMSDMHLSDLDPTVTGKIDNFLYKLNQKGSLMVGAIESFDRAHSFHASLEMAMNRGMTGQQALYGIFDTILKNNFLGGGLNPSWMKNPKVRALFLFQNTPFKIMERRLVNGLKTYESVQTAIGTVKKQDIKTTLKELAGLRKYVKEGEDTLKNSLIADALFADKDVFGTPTTTQFMREMLYMGATIYGLGSLFNADFHPHVFHVPFISTFGGDRPQLGVSPFANAAYRGLTRDRNSVDENGQEVGWVSQFLKDWLGKKQLVPQTFYKLNRISEGDIPEVYADSKFRYLFAVPTVEH